MVKAVRLTTCWDTDEELAGRFSVFFCVFLWFLTNCANRLRIKANGNKLFFTTPVSLFKVLHHLVHCTSDQILMVPNVRCNTSFCTVCLCSGRNIAELWLTSLASRNICNFSSNWGLYRFCVSWNQVFASACKDSLAVVPEGRRARSFLLQVCRNLVSLSNHFNRHSYIDQNMAKRFAARRFLVDFVCV